MTIAVRRARCGDIVAGAYGLQTPRPTEPPGATRRMVASPLSLFRRVAVGGGAIAAGIAEARNRGDPEVAVGEGGVVCQRGRRACGLGAVATGDVDVHAHAGRPKPVDADRPPDGGSHHDL